jgi:predicted nucleotidyltransferase
MNTFVLVTENTPGSLLLGRSKIRHRILALIMDSPDRRMHLRGIARAVETSAGTAARELGRLEGAGLVRRTREGNQVYFEARPEQPLFGQIRDVVRQVASAQALRDEPDPIGIAIARRMRKGLSEIYRKRLRGVFLYGSRARGEHGPDSDVDILIVLDHVGPYGEELERTSKLASDLSLDAGVIVSRAFASEVDWRTGAKPFLVSARADALEA